MTESGALGLAQTLLTSVGLSSHHTGGDKCLCPSETPSFAFPTQVSLCLGVGLVDFKISLFAQKSAEILKISPGRIEERHTFLSRSKANNLLHPAKAPLRHHFSNFLNCLLVSAVRMAKSRVTLERGVTGMGQWLEARQICVSKEGVARGPSGKSQATRGRSQ